MDLSDSLKEHMKYICGGLVIFIFVSIYLTPYNCPCSANPVPYSHINTNVARECAI
jgi:hypothetical protein